MADEAPTTTETTGVPAKHEAAGFPPFKTETFPSQLFWLAITFGFLFVVMWRVAGPRINAAITTRRGAINSAIADAGKARNESEAAQAGYETALANARARANALAEETRKSPRRRRKPMPTRTAPCTKPIPVSPPPVRRPRPP
jgi:F-type H+-transporting ATPase subunit b